jgi:hypothetical protein
LPPRPLPLAESSLTHLGIPHPIACPAV